MIAIIDYGAGNLKSVENALHHIGESTMITRDQNIIRHADKVILPGVGSFKEAMDQLNTFQLTELIREVAKTGKPFLGICLGLQLLFESSEESPGVSGLSILDGKVLKIPQKDDLKIPHIGWNSLTLSKDSKLLAGLQQEAYVYFVHSFYLKATDEDIVSSTTEYGTIIHASVERDNIFACQFHPEKSGDIGLRILKNFAKMK